MPISLESLTARHFSVVRTPTQEPGRYLFWKVRYTDPSQAARIPWLMDLIISRASPKVAPKDDEYAALEAASRAAKSPTGIDEDMANLSILQQIAREVVFAVSDDGEDWRDLEMVATEAERADPRDADGNPAGPMRLEVGFLDRITLQAIAYSAISRLEVVASAMGRFPVNGVRREGRSAGSDGEGLRSDPG